MHEWRRVALDLEKGGQGRMAPCEAARGKIEGEEESTPRAGRNQAGMDGGRGASRAVWPPN